MRNFSLIILLAAFTAQAQFDGPGGEPGSKSIPSDHFSIIAWATSATVVRGKVQINQMDNSLATLGDSSSVVGPFDGDLLSLGDSGVVTLSFAQPIQNNLGYDFAIFENGFQVGLSYYLELAHVEVSKNGVDFVRFPSESLSDTDFQTDNFGYTDPEKLRNLAGKHQAPYGTLFDLEEVGLSEVNYVRLVDVVGSIVDSLGSRDSKGRLINDPWPTPFASSGFDLDAVAVVNGAVLSTRSYSLAGILIYPSVADMYQKINVNAPIGAVLQIFDMQGKIVLQPEEHNFKLTQSGMYFVKISYLDKIYTQKIVVR